MRVLVAKSLAPVTPNVAVHSTAKLVSPARILLAKGPPQWALASQRLEPVRLSCGRPAVSRTPEPVL